MKPETKTAARSSAHRIVGRLLAAAIFAGVTLLICWLDGGSGGTLIGALGVLGQILLCILIYCMAIAFFPCLILGVLWLWNFTPNVQDQPRAEKED